MVSIQPEHLAQLARSQHVLEWLQTEKERVTAEMITIAQQYEREELKLRTLLRQHYGITGTFTLDTDKGVVDANPA